MQELFRSYPIQDSIKKKREKCFPLFYLNFNRHSFCAIPIWAIASFAIGIE